DLANLIENNGTGVNFQGVVQFNRILTNGIGLIARDDNLVVHNVFSRNTTIGISIKGAQHVQIFQNSIYSPTGDNIRIEGGAADVEVRNNALWSGGGFDIYVANDSRAGFFSDYNDLYSDGAGQLVFWALPFNDILDWQDNVAKFDLHSIGRTVVNPGWARPRFFSMARDDFRVFDVSASQRLSSPSVDAGATFIDRGLPPTG